MLTRVMTILLILFSFSSLAQDPGRLQYFEQKVNQSEKDGEKIVALANLAEYYSIFKLEVKADSILQKALLIAEVSSDKEHILKILFDNNITNLDIWSGTNVFERSGNFIRKGLQYAQQLNRNDYVALAYIRMASIYRKRNLFNEAIQYATEAFTALADIETDTLKCTLYNELGDIYLAKGEAVPAYKNYNNAFHIAYREKNVQLQSEVYHRFSELYRTLGDTLMGKKYLLQSLSLNIEHNYLEGQFKDYIDLTRFTDEPEYINKASALADKLGSDKYKLLAKRLLYYLYMVKGKNSSSTFKYLFSHPDLVQFFKNAGLANYHWQVGNIYHYSGNFDSAIHFYKLAETELTASHEPGIKLNINTALAESHLENGDSSMAKIYFEKTFAISKQINRLSTLPDICRRLGSLHEKNGDYKLAYYYTIQADSAEKLLQANAAKDKLVLLQVDQENKRMESDELEAQLKIQRKHNLQIMAITLLITGIFAMMLFVGMFAVSKSIIRMLGYFAFISLFEFIIVLLDHPIIEFTHGEPIKIWVIKIMLIALLVPCQHFMEHRLIGFLQSRKLLHARQRFSLRNWWHSIKKPRRVTNSKLEKDTAVL